MLLGAGLVVLLSVVLVVVGAVTPRLPIDDGLADLQGETRRVGEAALDDGWLMCHEPGDRLLSR